MAGDGSLDANVVLRLLLNDVPEQHAAAVRLVNGAATGFVVSNVAIIEVVFALCRHYQFSRDAVVRVLTGLMAQPNITCNRELLAPTLRLFVAHPKLSFEDCYLATYAELLNSQPLWTFDKKLAVQASSARLVPM
ncbi:MAG TPA: PIN domain-containing protein [Mycobacterium sp.]|nr:PIN domain-containing protein [Mycobacterium sp.]